MWALPLALLACATDDLPPRNCAARRAFYPDADGDGLGEPTDVYVGCEAPAGWVTELEPQPTGDTGATAETATPTDTGALAHTGGGSGR